MSFSLIWFAKHLKHLSFCSLSLWLPPTLCIYHCLYRNARNKNRCILWAILSFYSRFCLNSLIISNRKHWFSSSPDITRELRAKPIVCSTVLLAALTPSDANAINGTQNEDWRAIAHQCLWSQAWHLSVAISATDILAIAVRNAIPETLHISEKFVSEKHSFEWTHKTICNLSQNFRLDLIYKIKAFIKFCWIWSNILNVRQKWNFDWIYLSLKYFECSLTSMTSTQALVANITVY